MAQKIIVLPDIGKVVLAKRKGSKNLRLSITADGRVRVGLPAWAPYRDGISFALSRADWIKKHKAATIMTQLSNNARIGKSYRLRFVFDQNTGSARSRIAGNQIIIKSNLPSAHPIAQKVANAACERALKKDAEKLLPVRLRELALKNGFSYKSVRIKRLRSRWGSCSSQKEITLNYYLIQLPWRLVDYVILHELTHTTHLHHGPGFWAQMQALLPDVNAKRKEIRYHKPVLIPLA